MKKYAQIIVNISIDKLDQLYTYKIPPSLAQEITIGSCVVVPFGRREVAGFVIALLATPKIEESKIKEIKKIVGDTAFFDEQMLKLLKWVAVYYKANLIKVLNTAVPTGVISGKVSKKTKTYIKLNKSETDTKKAINKLKVKATKQAAVLETLLQNKDKNYTKTSLCKQVNSYPGAINALIKKGYLKKEKGIINRRPQLKKKKNRETIIPTEAQQQAIDKINKSVQENLFEIFLLHGVTGSGKTEVYLQVIAQVLKQDKGVIILVPEISLTPAMVKHFYTRFGEKIALLHSNLSLGERYDEWRRLQNGQAKIAIGARSAIFAPIPDLALIIIDEEHENSYKQGEYPYYHARELAFKRGKISQVPVVLGSATPSLESFYRAQTGSYRYLELAKRVKQEKLPPVKIVDMKAELKKGNSSIFSLALENAIKQALKKQEQVLIFLNRRGFANFILCRECGFVLKCKFCDISLTYHQFNKKLNCHYCNYSKKVPTNCPQCQSPYIKEFGIGTERIEEELNKLYPQANIARMDVDTTTRKGAHQQILAKLETGETDILVGTQMIAKGHDYPNVTVVGVITADTILNLPDFRSAERTFQLLTQVAGRTGRGEKKGQVIIQSYNQDHYSIQAASEHNYKDFYNQEIKLREKLNYPPFSYLVNIIINGSKEELVIKAAKQLGDFLQKYQKYLQEILGPTPASISKLKNKYRWQIILKFKDCQLRNSILNEIKDKFLIKQFKNINFNIDVDPIMMI